MAATATARSSAAPARRAPARRVSTPTRKTASRSAPARRTTPAPRRSPKRHTPVTGFVPVAVGAVGGIADSGVFLWLTRSRLWIGLLGTLLVGIVALNVLALGFSASSSNAAGEAEELARQNSALRAEIATTLSSEQVQGTASALGLLVPEPGAIRYVEPSPDDAARAAKRLRDGEFAVSTYVAPTAVVETTTTEPVVTDPAATTDPAVATDPAATETAAAPVDATATETVPPATETAAVPPSDTGSVVAP